LSVPPRTTAALVQGVLLADYDTLTNPDLTGFIAAASAVVDRVVTLAAQKGVTLSAGVNYEQELIERWLAAHFYTRSDQAYRSKSTGGASASFQGSTAMSLDASYYGQTAVNIDYSGALNAIGKRLFPQMAGPLLECGCGTGVNPSGLTSMFGVWGCWGGGYW
jgi:hypothetical protein